MTLNFKDSRRAIGATAGRLGLICPQPAGQGHHRAVSRRALAGKPSRRFTEWAATRAGREFDGFPPAREPFQVTRDRSTQ